VIIAQDDCCLFGLENDILPYSTKKETIMTKKVVLWGMSLVVVSGLVSVACAEAKTKAVAKSNMAEAKIEPKSGSTATGEATFEQKGGKVTLNLSLEKTSPGTHAVHIHDKGDCSSPDGKSAGEHWNPTSEPHGKWGVDGFHLGDIGNVQVGPDGKGTLTLTTDKWNIGGGGPNDVVGHAIIVHGGVDDFKSQPAGNAGPRVGCGVIEAAAGKKAPTTHSAH
jgi:Cu-Zn family superoxide dismutase